GLLGPDGRQSERVSDRDARPCDADESLTVHHRSGSDRAGLARLLEDVRHVLVSEGSRARLSLRDDRHQSRSDPRPRQVELSVHAPPLATHRSEGGSLFASGCSSVIRGRARNRLKHQSPSHPSASDTGRTPRGGSIRALSPCGLPTSRARPTRPHAKGCPAPWLWRSRPYAARQSGSPGRTSRHEYGSRSPTPRLRTATREPSPTRASSPSGRSAPPRCGSGGPPLRGSSPHRAGSST